jgi:hypothetical protein
MMLNPARTHIVILVLSAFITASFALAQRRTTTDAQRITKEDVVTTTAPSGCDFKFTVVEAKGELLPATRSMLRNMGYGVKGVPEGFGLPVRCGEDSGSGWIDQTGELQSFILPLKGWFVERAASEMKAVDGKLHIITKSLKLNGSDVEATYVRFAGAPLNQYSTRLLQDIGIGIKGVASPVLMKVSDGRKLRGTLAPEGGATITAETWKN